jgi:hypothetical protein
LQLGRLLVDCAHLALHAAIFGGRNLVHVLQKLVLITHGYRLCERFWWKKPVLPNQKEGDSLTRRASTYDEIFPNMSSHTASSVAALAPGSVVSQQAWC